MPESTHTHTAFPFPWDAGQVFSLSSVKWDWLATSLSCIGEGNGNPLQCSCWRIPETGETGGLPSLGSHRVGHDWSDLVAAAAAAVSTSSCWFGRRLVSDHLFPVILITKLLYKFGCYFPSSNQYIPYPDSGCQYHRKDPELPGEMADSRNGAGNTQDEIEASCNARK